MGGVLRRIMPSATPAEIATTLGATFALPAPLNKAPDSPLLSSIDTAAGAAGGASSPCAVFLIEPAIRVGATSCCAIASGETGADSVDWVVSTCAADGLATDEPATGLVEEVTG